MHLMAINYAIDVVHLHKKEGPADNLTGTQHPWCRVTPANLNGSLPIPPRIQERKSSKRFIYTKSEQDSLDSNRIAQFSQLIDNSIYFHLIYFNFTEFIYNQN